MTVSHPPSLSVRRGCPYAPPDQHRRLQQDDPIAQVTVPSGETVWAVTRHEDIRAMLIDPRFSSDRRRPDRKSVV